jgi:hypothetical protein
MNALSPAHIAANEIWARLSGPLCATWPSAPAQSRNLGDTRATTTDYLKGRPATARVPARADRRGWAVPGSNGRPRAMAAAVCCGSLLPQRFQMMLLLSRDCESEAFARPPVRASRPAYLVPVHRLRSREPRGASAGRPTRASAEGRVRRPLPRDAEAPLSSPGGLGTVASWPLAAGWLARPSYAPGPRLRRQLPPYGCDRARLLAVGVRGPAGQHGLRGARRVPGRGGTESRRKGWDNFDVRTDLRLARGGQGIRLPAELGASQALATGLRPRGCARLGREHQRGWRGTQGMRRRFRLCGAHSRKPASTSTLFRSSSASTCSGSWSRSRRTPTSDAGCRSSAASRSSPTAARSSSARARGQTALPARLPQRARRGSDRRHLRPRRRRTQADGRLQAPRARLQARLRRQD